MNPAVTAETRHGIVVVVLFALGLVSGLALVGAAGAAGQSMAQGLRAIFGASVYAVPIILLGLAAALVREERPAFSVFQVIGLALLALSLSGLLHLRLGPSAPPTLPGLADGGGYLGLVLAPVLMRAFGVIGSGVILATGVLIGIFLGFHLSFAHLRTVARALSEGLEAILLAARTARYHRKQRGDERPATFTEHELVGGDAQTDGALEDRADADDAHETEDEEHTPSENADALAAPARRRRRRPRVEVPLALLSDEVGKPTSGDIRAAQAIIQKTFANFRIEVEMGDVQVGPTVTQYTLRPADGVKLSRITALANDLALALAAHPIRIEAPIPGKSLVGIEVPNQKVAIVRLRECLESDAFKKRTSPISICLGKDVAGHVWTADIARMPHLLVAGATGSGKSVMLNTLILSLLFQNGPDDLRLLLVDPKRVEFPIYNGIPHLLTPVVTDVKKTVNALKWALAEMDRRFELLAAAHKRDLAAYNRTRRPDGRLPFLVIVIDELADLMAVAAAEAEAAIIRLAQMARAVGIHLVVATQRPSVDVITGLIKANITSRIAFAVASSTDSRTILDQVGADRLLGRGDMLYTSAELSKPKRLQGAFVTDQEIQRVVEHLREHGDTDYEDDLAGGAPIVEFSADGDDDGGEGEDDLLPDAREVLLQAGKGSASLLQRRLKIGYARAARILDQLERQGFIGPADGAKPREVYGEQGNGERNTPHTTRWETEQPGDDAVTEAINDGDITDGEDEEDERA